jgi:hypothetical protein
MRKRVEDGDQADSYEGSPRIRKIPVWRKREDDTRPIQLWDRCSFNFSYCALFRKGLYQYELFGRKGGWEGQIRGRNAESPTASSRRYGSTKNPTPEGKRDSAAWQRATWQREIRLSNFEMKVEDREPRRARLPNSRDTALLRVA